MSYVPIGVNLTQAKAQRLMSGHSVRLDRGAVGGNIHVHMTRRQADKITRHSRSGKGMMLRLSQAQIRHHRRAAHGIQNVDTSTTSDMGRGVGRGVTGHMKRPREPRVVHTSGAPLIAQTKQRKTSANHPVTTTFEKDPLPGEHYAIPQ